MGGGCTWGAARGRGSARVQRRADPRRSLKDKLQLHVLEAVEPYMLSEVGGHVLSEVVQLFRSRAS